ncbi:MAG TPA: outer membrane beta-barrel protein [Candidatus Deferrimicrobiaceae bacterium]
MRERHPGARFLPFVLLLLLLPAAARAEGRIEITPFAGFTFGGNFEDNTTGASLKVGESGSLGLILGYRDTPETHYELFYSFQRTDLRGSGTFGGNPLFDLDIHYLHLGGTYEFPGERKLLPFISGGLGVTFLVPTGEGLDSSTNFSLSLGGGVKVPVTGRVGLRFEGRGYMTILPDSTEVFCVSSGGASCAVRVTGDVLWQFQLLGGISFGL